LETFTVWAFLKTFLLLIFKFDSAIGNKLWRGNDRMIKVFSSGFQMKVGWTSTM
jgi:hypothetical protein